MFHADRDAISDQEAGENTVSIIRSSKGKKPGDLPVQGPTKFELVVNLKTAKTIGHHDPRGLVPPDTPTR